MVSKRVWPERLPELCGGKEGGLLPKKLCLFNEEKDDPFELFLVMALDELFGERDLSRPQP